MNKPVKEPAPPSSGRSIADPWAALRGVTPARIGLGRSGNAIPTRGVLDFQYAHALARDAVHEPLDVAALTRALQPLRTIAVASNVPDRGTYLRRPDLGRVLSPESLTAFEGLKPADIVFVVADGLSATGIQAHAAPLVHACATELADWDIGPIVLAVQGRVALGDDIAARLGARLCVMIIGERPGLTVSDSIGIYLTFGPRPGRQDSERNCISNIHPNGGLSSTQAACKLGWLAREALRRQYSGVALKDDMPSILESGAGAPKLSSS
ncbi:ethanolamine ammonia-lyase subunit EutC [Methylobacterium nodulans]|uniref:Ethanolamine ammonia-lyase small subunit n=1 Tax=Methylobacterium nodulans (strain LMG 21967 / CNCM I-2342 / ORS 2060) TaxID=460265 RepID=B8IW13_METNO|nr:ethanolamine ammonia-lyase subunit EutC [Methylobacterium nodulans]ACL62603.1 Ethanolamine ammonia-lyase light chain [Methylobacterium nodulans ORS 2060]